MFPKTSLTTFIGEATKKEPKAAPPMMISSAG
jgi:hypothetical protein